MQPTRLDNPLEYRKQTSDQISLPPKGTYPFYHSQRVWISIVDGTPTYATWDGQIDVKVLVKKTEEQLRAVAAEKARLEEWLGLVK